MIQSCKSCGAPAPADASAFSFICGFCGTKNVDDQYFKEYISKIDTGKANKLLQLGLASIKGGDYVQAEKSLESSVLEDERNVDAWIYLALCKAANVKPSNFEKNFQSAKDCLEKAKKIDTTEMVELGSINAINKFLESSINSANYYFDTANKKLIAFGKSGGAKQQVADEASRGFKLIRNVFDLNPTDTVLTASVLSYSISECLKFEKEIGRNTAIISEKEFFLNNLYNLYENHKEMVLQAVKQFPDKSTNIIKLLDNMKQKPAISSVAGNRESTSYSDDFKHRYDNILSNLHVSKKFMKNLSIVFGIIILIGFCSVIFSPHEKQVNVSSPVKSSSVKTKTVAPTAPASKLEAPVAPAPNSDNFDTSNLDFLKSFNGKYPQDVELLDNPVLSARLTKILGNKFSFLKERWAVSSPMTLNQNIFVAKGCEAHNCMFTNFIIIADIEKNLIYIGIREEQNISTYSEDGSDASKIINKYSDWISNGGI